MKKNKSKGWKKSRRRRERRREVAQGTNAGPETRQSRSKKAGRQIAA